MRIGYVRVSSAGQNVERQIEQLEQYGIEKWFVDKVSGKDFERPEYQTMFQFVREGDEIYVVDWSRFGRSLVDCLKQLELLQEKQVRVVSLKEGFDTGDAQGKFMMTIILAFNEMERTLIKERQAEGIAIAKRKGTVYKGRKKKPLPLNWKLIVELFDNKAISLKEACQRANMSPTTFYKYRNETLFKE